VAGVTLPALLFGSQLLLTSAQREILPCGEQDDRIPPE